MPSAKPRASGSETSVLVYRVAGLLKWVCSSSQAPGPGALNSICDKRVLAGFEFELSSVRYHVISGSTMDRLYRNQRNDGCYQFWRGL